MDEARVLDLKKLLLVTMTPPGTRNVGEVILRDLCSLLPSGSWSVCDVSPFPPVSLPVPYRHIPAPDESAWRPLPGRVGGALNHLRVRTRFTHQVDAARAQVLDFAREQGAEQLLVVLNSQSINAMGAGLARDSGLPMRSIVWDPPHATALTAGWDSTSSRWADRRFGEAIRASESAMVVSEPMVEEYSRRFGTRCEVVRHALSELRPLGVAGTAGPLRIGFAGTLYDANQLNCLLDALHSSNWRLLGRPVVLRMVGNFYRFTGLTAPANVELLGWRDSDETMRLLSECELNYLPVSFASHFRDQARLAFSTKLGAFLAAGRPVLAHGPMEAASVRFSTEQELGETCTSMDAGELHAALERLVSPAAYPNYVQAVGRCREAHFTRPVMRAAFARFLGVAESELLH